MAHSGSTYSEFGDFRADEAMRENQSARWDELRAECPVRLHTTATEKSMWYLLAYDDVRTAFQDPETFSSSAVEPWEPEELHALRPPWIPIEIDPPLHTDYRALVSPFFTPRAVANMTAGIREQCAQLIEDLAGNGHIEFITDFAKVFPTKVFMRLMGLPVEESDRMLRWIETLMHTEPTSDPDYQIRLRAQMETYEFLGALLDERRREPQQDILTAIVSTELPDRRLMTQDEALSMTFLLYMAGLDTVAAALAYIFAYLARHDGVRHELAAGEIKATDVAEELLRTHSIVNTGRVVTKDVEFAGCPMRTGDRVILSTAAANRDPNEFHTAGEIQIGRRPNRHIAFGAGPHRCLGSHLARVELETVLEEWHKRIPDYRIPDGVVLEDRPNSVSGLASLPLEWEA